MKVKIQIDTQTFVRFWLVVIGFALAALTIYSARTGLIILGVSLFLALALNGPVTKLADALPGKSRIGSTAIAFITIVAFLGTFLFLAVPPIVEQTAKFAQTMPQLVESARSQSKGLNGFIAQYHLQPQVDQALKGLNDNTSRWASGVGSSIVNGIGSFFSFMAAFILVLVLTFLMVVEGPMWMRRVWSLYTDESTMKYHRNIIERMHHVVSGYVTGQLTISGLGAAFAGLFVFILSFFFPVPANLAIPTVAITFVLSLIPMFGATIGGVLVTLLLLFNSPGAAIAYAIYFVIYQQIENNFVSPSIQSKRLDLSPLAVLAAVTIGLYVFGIAGGIISIPIAGCIKVLIEEYLAKARVERKESEKPVARLMKKLTKES